jgi:predicted hotdog family 3-hydroxylacyl-ACP dehydratase
MNPIMDRASIAALIPHEGAMCLLDGVIAWDRMSITCTASSHRAHDNPLAAEGHLDAVCGVEYAAQAMAMHGGLVGDGRRPVAGYLASLRDVICCVDRLDLLADALLVTAELLIADGRRVIYQFNLTSGGKPVMSGRAAVVIDARPRS